MQSLFVAISAASIIAVVTHSCDLADIRPASESPGWPDWH